MDQQLNVAMMYLSKTRMYKLPGGGIEKNETSEAAFLRELKEETGYEAAMICELGYIEEHKNKNKFMQFSYCYIAKALNKTTAPMLTVSEQQMGMTMKWMGLEEALDVLEDCFRNCKDYSSKFMILRDKTILEKAISLLKGEYPIIVG